MSRKIELVNQQTPRAEYTVSLSAAVQNSIVCLDAKLSIDLASSPIFHCWQYFSCCCCCCWYRLDLGVTWDFEIQLTWKFFNWLSDLVGIYFFQLTSKFRDSLFDLGYFKSLHSAHIAYAPAAVERISPHSAANRYRSSLGCRTKPLYTANTHRVTAQ